MHLSPETKPIYTEGTGMTDTSLDVKTYRKSVFGVISPQDK